jgi:hypothetical protein
MAIFTVTSGAASDLAVTKVSPISQNCFTLYEYIVTTNQGDNIDIELVGDHYEELYVLNGVENSFTDSALGIIYNTSLRVRFLLLNSGVAGVYRTATLTITNNTTGKFYSNIVTRNDDSANCYEASGTITSTSDLLNDGEDGINAFVDATDLAAYLPLAGGDMTGDINLQGGGAGTGSINGISELIFTNGVSNVLSIVSIGPDEGDWALQGAAGSDLAYVIGTDRWQIDGDRILTETDIASFSTDGDDIVFDPYLTITSTDVQAAIQELKDELDAASGLTVDATIMDSSTNPVENNAVYDALQLKADLAGPTFTGITTFDTDLELKRVSSDNIIDTNSSPLIISSSSQPNFLTFAGSTMTVGGSAVLNATQIITGADPYGSGWQSSLGVPTKGDLYTKIESIASGSGTVDTSGVPADNQIAVFTDSDTIEGTSGLTYDGSNLQLTGDVGSTGARITKGWFTDLEVSNTITGDVSGNAATVTSIGNLTGDVTSVNRVTTITAGSVDIPMLSASGTADGTTFLRGDNTWSVPAGGGDVSKVGTPVNNQIGVWTGDGTIEGDADLTFDGNNLSVGNAITAGGDITGRDGIFSRGTATVKAIGSTVGIIGTTTDHDLQIYRNSVNTINLQTSGVSIANRVNINNTGDQAVLLGLNSERSWHFIQDGTGSATNLALRDITGSKNLLLQNSSGDNVFTFSMGDEYFTNFHTADSSKYSRIGANSSGGFFQIHDGADATTIRSYSDSDFRYDINVNGNTVYHEGDFTYELDTVFQVTLTAGASSYTIGTQTNSFYRFGRLVHFSIVLSNISGTSPTGTLQVNLPSSVPPISDSVVVLPCVMEIQGPSFYSVNAINSGSKTLIFKYQSSLDPSSNNTMTDVDFSGSGKIWISGSYRAPSNTDFYS